MTAVLVARPLFPSESAAANGDGLSVVMLWIALGVFWLLGAIGRPEVLAPLRMDRRRRAAVGGLDHRVRTLGRAARNAPAGGQHALGMGRHGDVLFPGPAVHRHAARAPGGGRRDGRPGRGRFGLRPVSSCLRTAADQGEYKANPDQALRNVGLWFPPGSPERKAFEDRLANRQPMATFALTNSLAAFLAPWAVMLAGVVGRRCETASGWWRCWCV